MALRAFRCTFMTQSREGGDVQTGSVKRLSDGDASPGEQTSAPPPKVSFDNGGEFIRQTRRDVEEYRSATRAYGSVCSASAA